MFISNYKRNEPDLLEQLLFSIKNKLIDEPISYNIKLFEFIDRLFNDFQNFRMPFLKILQKSMQNFVVRLQNKDNDSIDLLLRKTVIFTIVNWNYHYGKVFPQVNLCLSFLRSKFKSDVESAEKSLQQQMAKKHQHNQQTEKETQRNYQHLLDVYRDNQVIIRASLKTIETCFSLLVPDLVEPQMSSTGLAAVPPTEATIFPGLDDGGESTSMEFLGPSTRVAICRAIDDDVAVDLSHRAMFVDVRCNGDNEDIVRTLTEEIGLLQRRFVPLLNNIIKKLKAFENKEKDLESVYQLSWAMMDSMRRFDKINIIPNDGSANLLSSDSEHDDSDFIDVP